MTDSEKIQELKREILRGANIRPSTMLGAALDSQLDCFIARSVAQRLQGQTVTINDIRKAMRDIYEGR